MIRPYDDACQQPASYDLRIAGDVVLPRLSCTLVPSIEWIELPCDLAATLRCRSSFGRQGIVITGGFVDPGFRGQLTLCLINIGHEDISVRHKDRIVQMIIHQVAGGRQMYDGRYQDSSGVVQAK